MNEIETVIALIGTILFVVFFFVPDHRLAAAGGTLLGVALLIAWL